MIRNRLEQYDFEIAVILSTMKSKCQWNECLVMPGSTGGGQLDNLSSNQWWPWCSQHEDFAILDNSYESSDEKYFVLICSSEYVTTYKLLMT